MNNFRRHFAKKYEFTFGDFWSTLKNCVESQENIDTVDAKLQNLIYNPTLLQA